MSSSVGIAELRQNLSRYLERVRKGERLVVTDRNRPVAELGPPSTHGTATLDRLIAEGRATRGSGSKPQKPLKMTLDDPYALSHALEEIRGER